MNSVLLRAPLPEELPAILDIWERSFGDPPELIRSFLRAGALLDGAVAAVEDGRVRSVMFAFEHLRFGASDAAYLYALCTHPDSRGRGLGGAVVRELCRRCFDRGADLVFLSPADEALADWYAALLGMRTMQRFEDAAVSLADSALPCRALSPEDYLLRRRGSLRLTPELLRAQAVFLEGGGYYEVGGALACACPEGDLLRVIELQCAPEQRSAVLGALARQLKCRRALLRTPSETGTRLQFLRRDRGDFPAETADPFFFTMG